MGCMCMGACVWVHVWGACVGCMCMGCMCKWVCVDEYERRFEWRVCICGCRCMDVSADVHVACLGYHDFLNCLICVNR